MICGSFSASKMCRNSHKVKFTASKCVKMAAFEILKSLKLISRKKSEWLKNPVNFGSFRFVKILPQPIVALLLAQNSFFLILIFIHNVDGKLFLAQFDIHIPMDLKTNFEVVFAIKKTSNFDGFRGHF